MADETELTAEGAFLELWSWCQNWWPEFFDDPEFEIEKFVALQKRLEDENGR